MADKTYDEAVKDLDLQDLNGDEIAEVVEILEVMADLLNRASAYDPDCQRGRSRRSVDDGRGASQP